MPVVIGQIEPAVKGRRCLHLDNGEEWQLYASELRAYGLCEGMILDDASYEKIRRETLGKRAKKRAMHLLEHMDRTEAGLKRKLCEGGYPPDLADEAVAYVKSYHYVDDARYADCYIRLHGSAKSTGKLRMELQQRGVPRETIDAALESCEEERDEPQMIRELLQKRGYDPKTADAATQRRMYGYLMRRGFQSADICRELNV